MKLSDAIIPPWVKWAALGLLVLILVGGGWWMKSIQAENVILRATMKDAVKRINAEQATNLRQDTILAKRDEAHQEIRDHTSDVTVRIQQETANDPQARATLTSRIPDSVRRAYSASAAARSAAQHPDDNRADSD